MVAILLTIFYPCAIFLLPSRSLDSSTAHWRKDRISIIINVEGPISQNNLGRGVRFQLIWKNNKDMYFFAS